MGATRIDLDVARGAAWITLNGVDRRNALDAEAVASLVAACDRIDADPAIGVAVVTGAGSAFCSGADTVMLERLRSAPPEVRNRELDRLYAGFLRFADLTVPTVAAINGAAIGAGLNLALAADLRVMAKDAILISGFSRVGIHPGGGHMHLLARISSAAVAAAMGVFARPMPSETAVAAGIAWAAVEREELHATVESMIGHLAADPPLARALATDLHRTVLDASRWDAAVAFEREWQSWSLGRSSDANQES